MRRKIKWGNVCILVLAIILIFSALVFLIFKLKSEDTQNQEEKSIVQRNKPIITFNEKVAVVCGEEADLLRGVTAKDETGALLNVSVEGDYDTNNIGVYKLKYVATDKNNLTTKENFTVYVLQKLESISQESTSPIYFTTSKGFEGVEINGITYIDGILVANKTYALPESYNPGKLNSIAYSNATKMLDDSKKENLNIWIQSGFRSYELQSSLYYGYGNGDGFDKADTYSARPGHSEHQSGLAFDVNEIDYTFDDTPEANWLSSNCYKYGFILRYPKGKTDETGYVYESWHFRYVGVKLATKLYNNGDWITLEDYFGITSKYDS